MPTSTARKNVFKLNHQELHLIDYLSDAQIADIGTASLDVSAEIAEAIADFGLNGGTLIVPGLVGLGVTGIALANKTGIVIAGRGPKAGFKSLAVSTTTVATWGVSAIRITSGTRCGLYNLYIDGNSKAHNPIAIYQGTECFVERLTIISSGLNASIMAGGNTRNHYHGNVVKDGVGSSRGLWIGNTNSTEAETDALIDGNFVDTVPASGIGGLLVRGVISNNHCINTSGAGIVQAASSAVRAKEITVSGNICKGNAFHGIQIGDPALAGDYVEAISVTGNICDGNSSSGIACFDARDSTIAGNVCKDNGDAGIRVETAKRLVINGNNCYDSRSGGSRTQDFGIRLVAQTAVLDIEDIDIAGNVCRNHTNDGIQATTAGSGTIDTILIIGNKCVDNSERGIAVTEAAAGNIAQVVAVGNTCLGNTTADLRVDPTNAVIEGNKYLTQSNLILTFTNLDTTPSVSGRKLWRCNNTGATTITNFDDGVEGQEITILFSDANTTINDGGNFLLSANFTSTIDDVLKLVQRSSVWYEVSRSVN